MKTFSGSYVIDKNAILNKTYRLLCLFFANKEIARRSDPDDPEAPLKALERRFFEGEVSRLLIEIAVAIRVLDDQMKRLHKADEARKIYEKHLAKVDKYQFGLFDDLKLNLRKTCNKIIHSDVMEPHTKEGWEPHEFDSEALYGDGDQSINWEHLNGYVRLAGRERKEEWYVLLDVEVFVTAVYEICSD